MPAHSLGTEARPQFENPAVAKIMPISHHCDGFFNRDPPFDQPFHVRDDGTMAADFWECSLQLRKINFPAAFAVRVDLIGKQVADSEK
jgi:hypothetical protein